MKLAISLMAASALLAGCTMIPAGVAHSACGLLQTASNEADMAPAWYLHAGEVLERCGYPGAKAEADTRACFASARNGYRDSKECEAMP